MSNINLQGDLLKDPSMIAQLSIFLVSLFYTAIPLVQPYDS